MQKSWIKYFIGFSFGVFILMGCRQDKASSSLYKNGDKIGFYKVKLPNGAVEEVSVDPIIVISKLNQDSLYKLTLNFTTVTPEYRSLSMISYIHKGKGVYILHSDNLTPQMTFKFSNKQEKTGVFYCHPMIKDTSDVPLSGEAQLKITHFSDTLIVGNFSARLFSEKGQEVQIKNGRFLIPMHK